MPAALQNAECNAWPQRFACWVASIFEIGLRKMTEPQNELRFAVPFQAFCNAQQITR